MSEKRCSVQNQGKTKAEKHSKISFKNKKERHREMRGMECVDNLNTSVVFVVKR